MKREILFLAMTIIVTGCVTVPKSSSQLVDTSTTRGSFCYSLSREDVGTRVERFLGKCYGPVEAIIPVGGIYVPMKADFQVINEELPNGNRYSVRNFVGFGYSADVIDGTENCKTTVNMYAVSGFWKNTFSAVDLAIKGGEPKCPK
ncbi:MAG: hypothetical protein OQL11_08390 [Gammaproteobacteria bacterium]|nr:hypothetical protein [Gammaproteobacteria bacterium]